MKFFVILIKFSLPCLIIILGQSVTLLATECSGEKDLIVTSPRQGARTNNTTVAFRGFTCRNAHIILVHNETTDDSFIADTDELCDGKDCVYRFATFIHNLAIGVNKIRATIPGQDPKEVIPIQIVRTALVWNEKGLEPTRRNFFPSFLALPYNGYKGR